MLEGVATPPAEQMGSLGGYPTLLGPLWLVSRWEGVTDHQEGLPLSRETGSKRTLAGWAEPGLGAGVGAGGRAIWFSSHLYKN